MMEPVLTAPCWPPDKNEGMLSWPTWDCSRPPPAAHVGEQHLDSWGIPKALGSSARLLLCLFTLAPSFVFHLCFLFEVSYTRLVGRFAPVRVVHVPSPRVTAVPLLGWGYWGSSAAAFRRPARHCEPESLCSLSPWACSSGEGRLYALTAAPSNPST